jgi:riboflavin synthase
MFTGIVQGLCTVAQVEEAPNLRRIALELGELASGLATGASVAINGTCLTVTGIDPNAVVRFDVIQETVALTNLGQLRAGDLVNVERSFRVGDEIGGHILSGHVTDQAVVRAVMEADNLRNIHFSIPPQWMRYLHHKGFIALDGASLTLAGVDQAASEISISLIPETIERTTLGRVAEGARINMEIDSQTQAVVDTVERMIDSPEMLARIAAQLAPDQPDRTL